MLLKIKTLSLLISLAAVLTIMASWTRINYSGFHTSQYQISTQKDTIYTFENPPKIEACIKKVLDSLNIVFDDGAISKIERNFSTTNQIKQRLGSDFDKILMKESRCSNQWKRFLKSLNGKSKSNENKDNYSVTEYWSFAVVKSRKGIHTYGQIDGLLKVQFDIEFDSNGKCIKNESKKKFISVF